MWVIRKKREKEKKQSKSSISSFKPIVLPSNISSNSSLGNLSSILNVDPSQLSSDRSSLIPNSFPSLKTTALAIF